MSKQIKTLLNNITIKEINELSENLKMLKEKNPSKFYEFKVILNTITSIYTGKEIETISSNNQIKFKED